MRKSGKFIACALTLAMSASAFSGCGSADNSTAKGTEAVSDAATEAEEADHLRLLKVVASDNWDDAAERRDSPYQ